MKVIFSWLFVSAMLFAGAVNAETVSTIKNNHASFSPVSWSFKQGEKSKIVYNPTKQVFYVQINIQSGGASVTVDGENSNCGNIHLNEIGLNTVICTFGSNDTLYIDNDVEYGLASGTYQLEP